MHRYVYIALLLTALFLSGQLVTLAQDQPSMIDIAVSQILDEPLRDVVITPDARHIYVITESGALLGFAFDRGTAELSPLDGFPLDLSGISYRPTALAAAPGGRVVYVAHAGAVGRSLLAPVTILSRDAETGLLAEQGQFSLPIDGSQLTDIAFSAGGDSLVVAGTSGKNIAVIPLEHLTADGVSGDFTQIELPEKPDAAAISTDSRFVYAVNSEAGTVRVFGFNSTSGSYEEIEGSPFTVQGNAYQPADIAISRDSTRLYIAHSGFIQRSLLSPVTFHTLNLNTGELLDMSRTGFPSEGSGLAAISVDESGQFLVLADNGTKTLHVIRQAMPQIQPPAPVSTQTITLEPYRTFCSGVGPRLCYLAIVDGQQQLFYDDIEGFTYEWGTRYELLVTVLPAANPPADGSSLRYVLDSIVSAEPVADDETFEITLPPAIIEQNDDGTYSVLGELRFVCSGLGCELLGDLLAGSDPIGFVMRFPAALGDPFDARLQVER